MCGICGLLTFDQSANQPEAAASVRRMMARMARRGPDAQGEWGDPDGRLRLGFRRLAILDLTSAGDQPMLSSTGRSVVVFNGEIYNHPELRRELEAHGRRFRSRSDTEVLLAALEHWGPDGALRRLNGMFAFAWYDLAEKQLVLARDHAGIKPLYYCIDPAGRGLAFASQYNLLFEAPWGEPGAVRLDALRLYLRLHHLPPPYTLHRNTFQLQPGHFVTIRADGQITQAAWWELPRDPRPDLSGTKAVDALEQVLEDAVARQRIADVPLGTFLSGGVDSPLVSAVARRQNGPGLQAYTIGNPGWRQDESAAAERFASLLDLDFHLQNVTGEDVLEVLPQVWEAQHEPFADYSILPALLVSRFARQGLTVALSGDGGDELFYGYERPLSLLRDGRDFRHPWALRYGLYALGRLGLGRKRSEAVAAPSPAEYYFGVNSRLDDERLAQIAPGLPGLPDDFHLYAFDGYHGERHLAGYSRYVEYYGQLQRCLKKVDMASMHHSLEVRVPLLDREVIEASLRIDPFTHMEGGRRKQVLVRLLERHVPAESISPAKRGFAVPLGDWLRGPLRPLVEAALFDGELYPAGVFDKAGLRTYWHEHLTGHADHKWGLWTLLALQGWAREHLPQAARDPSVNLSC